MQYPELSLVGAGADYGRFDHLHMNRAADGTGADETLQLLSGGGIRIFPSLPDLGVVTLFLDCPSPDGGWTDHRRRDELSHRVPLGRARG